MLPRNRERSPATAANAFACRSSSRWAGALGWTRNRFLVAGVGIELALLVGFVFVAPLAALLGHAGRRARCRDALAAGRRLAGWRAVGGGRRQAG
jgi:hypothetical protein